MLEVMLEKHRHNLEYYSVFSFKLQKSFSDNFQVYFKLPEGNVSTGFVNIILDASGKKIGVKYKYPSQGLRNNAVRVLLDRNSVKYNKNKFDVDVITGLGPAVLLSILDHYRSEYSDIEDFRIANSTHKHTDSNIYHLKKVGFDAASFANRLACTFNLIKGEKFSSYYGKLARYIESHRSKENFQEFSVDVI